MALYELTDDIKRLYLMAEDDDVDDQTLHDTMEAVQGEFDDKCANIGRLIKSLEADAKEVGDEVARLSAKRQRIQNRATWFKIYLLRNMQAIGRQSAGDAVTGIRIQKNGGKLPLVIDKDVPKTYQKKVMQVDNEKIREALDSGKKLSFAHYGERGESVRIK